MSQMLVQMQQIQNSREGSAAADGAKDVVHFPTFEDQAGMMHDFDTFILLNPLRQVVSEP
uniref:Uncharacterized protein n=1 Tax=Utricularia reniformis TaxID=192314 RepID=A0A1Y0B427_9LAMI|nr:hypothetical protein AEK19_MT2011 [Utricularia reniformis]ART32171.1 hypothetical protein AEK19_MT2011 [Utricularia reniformis]